MPAPANGRLIFFSTQTECPSNHLQSRPLYCHHPKKRPNSLDCFQVQVFALLSPPFTVASNVYRDTVDQPIQNTIINLFSFNAVLRRKVTPVLRFGRHREYYRSLVLTGPVASRRCYVKSHLHFHSNFCTTCFRQRT